MDRLIFDTGSLASLSRDRLEAMLLAGGEVRACMRVLAKTGDNVVGELLRDVETFYEWDHYPKGDVYDHETHAQYYYHAHPQADRPGEHGHFHTFLRAPGMPRGVRPAPVPGAQPTARPADIVSHLIGISMDGYGMPIALFTTNRWVTDEVWHSGEDVIRMLDFFEVDMARPSWPVNRWVTAMVHLYRPQVEALIRARDARVAAFAAAHGDADIFEDRRLEVASELPVSIDQQIAAIEAALAR